MKYLCWIPFALLWNFALGQDSLRARLQVNGYLKDLQSLNYQENLTNLITGNLIHHRLNVRWHPMRGLTTAVELRDRLFWGEEVATVPDFSGLLRNRNEALDLTWNLVEDERMVLNSTIDRLWIEYAEDKWNLRIGRQRVNWGIGTTWNPNDLFNTFNFLDFDYEERPGIDGLKLQYITGEMDYIETSVSFTKEADNMVAAVKYFKNVANYDLQFLVGMYHEQPTAGVGWSGSIRETGFKGEFQYFLARNNTAQQLNACIEADHVFSKGWYLNLGAFLNSTGATSSQEVSQLTNLRFSPRALMPTKWNTSIMASKELTPLITLTATVIYSPRTNLTIFLPAMTYNASEDLEISFVWQSFFIDRQSSFDDLSHRCFLRFKWSH